MSLVDYIQALEDGEMKVAYARVMLVGPGGVGKSSLLHGLMNLPLPTEACSTQLADTFTLRPTDTYWARSKCSGHWIKVTDKDEIDELVQLVRARNKLAKKLKGLESEVKKDQDSPELKEKFTHPQVKEVVDEAIKAASSVPSDSPLANATAEAIDTYLRIWDCGGQPVFLDILPAFLTARTLFLLMFDARYDLQSPCLHRSHLHGVATGQVAETSTLQLMVQWMALIHATLLRKKSLQNATDEIDRFPQILPVGTHGDDEAVKEKGDTIFDSLYSICADKAFTHLLLDGVVVDNTTAGNGEFEDPFFQNIREIASKFSTEDLAIRTPITWVLFRKVFERYARERPVILLEEVVELGKECSIRGQALLSVLAFYHDLAVFFHYSSITSLQSHVISNPQWLIRQMAKILALKGHEQVRKKNLWRLLREDGILVEPLYDKVLRTQQELEPQAIIDLLEHFLIIAEIHTKDRHKCPGREYFVPSVLPSCSTEGTPRLKTGDSQSAPLHLIFSTNYLPPGFFVRLATAISKNSKSQVDFQTKMYRNAISFFYGRRGEQVDRLTVLERKFSVHIQVQHLMPQSVTFIRSCHEIMKMLQKAILKVQEWLPGIDVGFALECHKCTDSNHFIPLPEHSRSTTLLCQQKVPTEVTAEQKLWYCAHQVSATYS